MFKWIDKYIIDSIDRKPNVLDIFMIPFILLRYIELCEEYEKNVYN